MDDSLPICLAHFLIQAPDCSPLSTWSWREARRDLAGSFAGWIEPIEGVYLLVSSACLDLLQDCLIVAVPQSYLGTREHVIAALSPTAPLSHYIGKILAAVTRLHM